MQTRRGWLGGRWLGFAIIAVFALPGAFAATPEKPADSKNDCAKQTAGFPRRLTRRQVIALGALSTVGLAGLITWAAWPKSVPPEEAPTLEEWQLLHSAANPLVAYNRASSWPLEIATMQAVAANPKKELVFKEPIWNEGKPYSKITYAAADELTPALEPFSREDADVVQSLHKVIQFRKDDELVIALLTSLRSFDYYVAHSDVPAHYFHLPWNASTLEGTDEFREFLALMGRERRTRELGKSDSLMTLVDSYRRLNEGVRRSKKTAAQLFADRTAPTQSKVILIGGVSGSHDVTAIRQLPSAEKLLAAGIKNVTLVFEELPRRTLTIDEVRSSWDSSILLDDEGKDRAAFIAEVKGKSPRAAELFASGHVQRHADIFALLDVWKIYSDGKISVKALGLVREGE